MAVFKVLTVVAALCALAAAQRPFYAGIQPIGYPVTSNPLSNRFGEDADLPILAKGDGNLLNSLNQMPIDKRPFWYLNWRQYDAIRKNPQTYQPNPNSFISN